MALNAAITKTLVPRPSEEAFELKIELSLESGITALLGPSGSGKTTLLRCLAGLDRPESGFIRQGDRVLFDAARRIHLPPQHRRVGMVFNDYALFPRMSVRANVAYAGADTSRVDAMLDRFELRPLETRVPAQLSAGQQQRVALARALLADPLALLLDEPFAALDAPLRERLQDFLLPLLAELDIPVLWVTHDLDEACRVAETILLLDQGTVIRTGRPQDLLERPGTRRAAELMGFRNLFTGRMPTNDQLCWGPVTLNVRRGASYGAWGIRPDHVQVVDPVEAGVNGVMAIVTAVRPMLRGLWFRAEVAGAGALEGIHAGSHAGRVSLALGETIGLRLPMSAIFPLDDEAATSCRAGVELD